MTEAALRQFGIVQIGDTLLGIPIEHLLEVFHVRKEEQLPQKSALLRGGISLRGQLVPVLDVQKLGHLTHVAGKSRFGVVLEHAQRILAIFVDEIVGITTVASDDIYEIANPQSTDAPIFGDAFAYDDKFVSQFDIPRMFSLPDLYTVRRSTAMTGQSRRILDPVLTFAAGGALYAVPAVEVYAAIHKQTIQKTAITVGPCLGEVTYHGRRIPVLCPVQILGLGKRDPQLMTEVVALRFPGDLVLGFAVDAIHEIGTFDEGIETTLPIWQADRNFIEKIILSEDGSQVYAVDLPQIYAAADLQDIAKLSAPETDADDTGTSEKVSSHDVTPQRERYLVVDAAERVAIPLSQINCIVEQPTAVTPTHTGKPGFRGYFSRSDESIALFDLGEFMGRASMDSPSAKVLLTGQPGHQVGYIVNHVVSIELSEWCEKPTQDTMKAGVRLVQLGIGTNASVLPTCRLPDAHEHTTVDLR